jgi:DNA-binding XRE family transcriptional regulator
MKIDPIRKKRAGELRQLRIEKGINRVELSTLSGLSRTTIIRIETGTIGWNIDSEIIYFETIMNYLKNN